MDGHASCRGLRGGGTCVCVCVCVCVCARVCVWGGRQAQQCVVGEGVVWEGGGYGGYGGQAGSVFHVRAGGWRCATRACGRMGGCPATKERVDLYPG